MKKEFAAKFVVAFAVMQMLVLISCKTESTILPSQTTEEPDLLINLKNSIGANGEGLNWSAFKVVKKEKFSIIAVNKYKSDKPNLESGIIAYVDNSGELLDFITQTNEMLDGKVKVTHYYQATNETLGVFWFRQGDLINYEPGNMVAKQASSKSGRVNDCFTTCFNDTYKTLTTDWSTGGSNKFGEVLCEVANAASFSCYLAISSICGYECAMGKQP